jgi:hypothetical protein
VLSTKAAVAAEEVVVTKLAAALVGIVLRCALMIHLSPTLCVPVVVAANVTGTVIVEPTAAFVVGSVP